MSKTITLESCTGCPFMDHRGAFGAIAYVPKCRQTSKDLPYTLTEVQGRAYAHYTGEIPEWCPLTSVEKKVELDNSDDPLQEHVKEFGQEIIQLDNLVTRYGWSKMLKALAVIADDHYNVLNSGAHPREARIPKAIADRMLVTRKEVFDEPR